MLEKRHSILIIDDDSDICRVLNQLFQSAGYDVSVTQSGTEAMHILERKAHDLVLVDYKMEDMDGLEVLLRIRDMNPHMPVIVMTAYSDIKTAVSVMKHGATDYVVKPLYPDEIQLTVRKTLEEFQGSPDRQLHILKGENQLLGENPVMKAVQQQIDMVAATPYSVLVTGEGGTGKELTAQTIHNRSERHHKPFISIDCSVFNHNDSMDELLGRGNTPGYVEKANGGTLFLDGLPYLLPEFQTMLMRILTERKLTRLDSNITVDLNVRVISSAYDDMKEGVRQGNFREDLYYFLNEFMIHLPPLRQRNGDVMLLAEHFLKQANQDLNKNLQGFTLEAKEKLNRYPWPGNVRELRNTIRRLTLLSLEDKITADELPTEIKRYQPGTVQQKASSSHDLKATALEAEREMILKVLRQVNFNRTKAAQLLKIDRKTLYNKLRGLNLD